MKRLFFLLAPAWLVAVDCRSPAPEHQPVDAGSAEMKSIRYQVVDSFAHDTSSYTEGFLFHKGSLFESTGYTENHPGTHSLFGVLDLKTGGIDVKARLEDRKYFGEGIVFIQGKIFQLTDTTEIGFIYDEAGFRRVGRFRYKGEGWGLTSNGKYIIMSNGSSVLTYRDPATFGIVKTLSVTDNNGPVSNLNELELVGDDIYANQWLSDYILQIDTLDGKVKARIDLAPLRARALAGFAGAAEANGIAWDSASRRFFITGKLWPKGYSLQTFP